ncbi:MAG: pantoate--beta-alanine ligase [Rikenellaceae bacterium]|jgi:pantoate--beta-alanine ligase|nr:pantoate--beta-alanine ligase [Rikenellaceae bacterium]
MQILTTAAEVRRELDKRSATVGFVPTMGALHAGHISLVERARAECDTVVVSIFVNPTQFNDPDDLIRYPRTPEADCALLAEAGTDIVFMPSVEEIYPAPDTRQFAFGALERVMEGEHRPGHFNGVGQVVSRLLEIVAPDRAYFGEKDYQQLAIIRELVRQLALPLEIVGCPIRRDADGLALSSRNVRLNAEQRAAAPAIYRTLVQAGEKASEMDVEQLEQWVAEQIDAVAELKTEYIAVADAATLQPVASWDAPGDKRIFAAVWAGDVRLIDNIAL